MIFIQGQSQIIKNIQGTTGNDELCKQMQQTLHVWTLKVRWVNSLGLWRWRGSCEGSAETFYRRLSTKPAAAGRLRQVWQRPQPKTCREWLVRQFSNSGWMNIRQTNCYNDVRGSLENKDIRSTSMTVSQSEFLCHIWHSHYYITLHLVLYCCFSTPLFRYTL